MDSQANWDTVRFLCLFTCHTQLNIFCCKMLFLKQMNKQTNQPAMLIQLKIQLNLITTLTSQVLLAITTINRIHENQTPLTQTFGEFWELHPPLVRVQLLTQQEQPQARVNTLEKKTIFQKQSTLQSYLLTLGLCTYPSPLLLLWQILHSHYNCFRADVYTLNKTNKKVARYQIRTLLAGISSL